MQGLEPLYLSRGSPGAFARGLACLFIFNARARARRIRGTWKFSADSLCVHTGRRFRGASETLHFCRIERLVCPGTNTVRHFEKNATSDAFVAAHTVENEVV